MSPDEAKREFEHYIAGYLNARLNITWEQIDGQWWPNLDAVINSPEVRNRLRTYYKTNILSKVSGD